MDYQRQGLRVDALSTFWQLSIDDIARALNDLRDSGLITSPEGVAGTLVDGPISITPRGLAVHRAKSGNPPKQDLGSADSDYVYDVAISFAGEDREIADRIAGLLKSKGVTVFYDLYEKDSLWGKNLYEHLREIYSRQARYCVILASQDYSKKVWTRHEMQSAQERALREKGEYILPIRLDDTEVPGLPTTVGYIDMKDETPESIAELVMKKLGRARM